MRFLFAYRTPANALRSWLRRIAMSQFDVFALAGRLPLLRRVMPDRLGPEVADYADRMLREFKTRFGQRVGSGVGSSGGDEGKAEKKPAAVYLST